MYKNYYVYILTNKNKTVLYVGVTSDLIKRVHEHKMKLVEGFTKKYNLASLIYFEQAENSEAAIEREKQIKGWTRLKKDRFNQSFKSKLE